MHPRPALTGPRLYGMLSASRKALTETSTPLRAGQRAWESASQVREQGGKSFLSCRLNARATKPGRSGPRYYDLAMMMAAKRPRYLGEQGWYRASQTPVPLVEGRVFYFCEGLCDLQRSE